MDDAKRTYERVTQLAIELGDEILRLAVSKEGAFHLSSAAAATIRCRVGLGIKAPKFRGRMAAAQNERRRELGIQPQPILAGRPIGGD